MRANIVTDFYAAYRSTFRLRRLGKGAWPLVDDIRQELVRLSKAGVGAAGGFHSPKYYDDQSWVKAESSAAYLPLPGRRLWTESTETHTWETQQKLIQLARLVTRKKGKAENEEGAEGGYAGGALVTPGAVFETTYDPYCGLVSITGIALGDRTTSTDFGALGCSPEAEAILREEAMSLPSNAGAILWTDNREVSGHELIEADGLLFSGPVLDLLKSRLDDPKARMLVLERLTVPGRFDIAILSTPKRTDTMDKTLRGYGRQALAVFAL